MGGRGHCSPTGAGLFEIQRRQLGHCVVCLVHVGVGLYCLLFIYILSCSFFFKSTYWEVDSIVHGCSPSWDLLPLCGKCTCLSKTCVSPSAFAFFFKDLFSIMRERKRGETDPLSIGSLFRCSQWLVLGQATDRSFFSVSHVCAVAQALGSFSAPSPKYISRELHPK